MSSKLIANILFHRYNVAVEIIEEAVGLSLGVHGIETFTLRGLSVQPHLEHSFLAPNIEDVERLGKMQLDFLHSLKDRDFWYEVLTDDPEALIERNDDRNYVNLQTGKRGAMWRYLKD